VLASEKEPETLRPKTATALRTASAPQVEGAVAPTPKFPDESIVVEPAALTVLDALSVVNAPVLGVVAPTVPLNALVVSVAPVIVGLVASTLLPDPVFVTLTMFLLASNARAVDAVRPDRVAVLDAERVVNAPAAGVVLVNDPTTANPVELNVPTVVEVLA